MRRLVVTADDFGAAAQVNEAVEDAHLHGVLTAASLMVAGPAAADAVDRARRLPTLRVGLHLVLVDGPPILPAAQVQQLVDARGRFRDDMIAAATRMFLRPEARRQLKAEITAQFAAFAATGLSLDHVNAHKHFHLHPTIAGAILEIGAGFGMGAVRVPIEPGGILSQVEPGGGSAAEPLVAFWASLARRRFRRAGVLAPDQVFGLRWSGAMTAGRLMGLLERLPPGLSEIYLHPAANGDFEGAAKGYSYAAELAALTDPDILQAARPHRRGGFADFAAASLPVAA